MSLGHLFRQRGKWCRESRRLSEAADRQQQALITGSAEGLFGDYPPDPAMFNLEVREGMIPQFGVRYFFSRTEVAEYLHLKSLGNVKLPPPDVMVGGYKGWKPSTIDLWNS